MGVLHILGADLLAGFRPEGGLSFTELSTEELLRRLRGALDLKLHGLGFSAYGEGQGPDMGPPLTEASVRARLEMIAPHTQWIRTFSCTEGHELAPAIAHELGMKTLVGAWIGEDAEKNAEEIAGVIALARAGHADLVAVGNEVLLRGEMTEDELIAQIRTVKAAVPDVPVGYVDAYFLFARHPRLVEACDFLPVNCYPFWEKIGLQEASGYAKEMVRRVTLESQGKPVIIAETGWPTAGTNVGAAVPSLRNMALYALNVLAWTDAEEIPLFWFSAFDEAWKVGPEGDCGAYWGLWDAAGGSKLGQ
jgi:glucan 1,3-beta-glucosidase